MTDDDKDALQHYDRILRSTYGGRRFLLFGGPLAGLAKTARALHTLGAAPCSCWATPRAPATRPSRTSARRPHSGSRATG